MDLRDFASGKCMLMSLLERGADEHSDKGAVATPAGGMGYADAYALACRFALGLSAVHGIGKGSVVALYISNRAVAPSLLAALEWLGARVAMRPPSLVGHAVAEDAEILGTGLVFVDDDEARAIVEQECPGLRVLVARRETADELEAADDGSASALDLPQMVPGAEVVLFTSGSTGAPKPIVNRFASFERNAVCLGNGLGVKADDVLYAPVPIFHVYGFISIFVALVNGVTWVTLHRYSVHMSLELMERLRASVCFCVPTMLSREMNLDKEHPHDLSALRVCMVAGDGCVPYLLSEFEDRYDCRVVLSYGMTETAATLTVEDPSAPKELRLSSNGAAIEGVTLSIDPANGEILVETPSFMSGIIDAGTHRLEPADCTKPFRTGDIGRLDADGRLYVTGRIKNIIVRGGMNISPANVERVYGHMAAVSDCAAVGYPDKQLGQRLCLFVVPEEGYGETLESLRAYGRDKLEKGSLPDKVIELNVLPQLANGKLDAERLKRLAAE